MTRVPILLVLLALLHTGCESAHWVDSADRDVEAVLAEKSAAFEEFRQNGLILKGMEAPERDDAAEEDLSGIPTEMGLRETLAVAVKRNRTYISERESLYIAALNLTRVRNDFSTVFSGALSAVLSDSDDSNHVDRETLRLGASRILPTGGTVSLDGSTTVTGDGGRGGSSFDSDVTVSLNQPLLRDSGYETSHEALTQSERNVVYAIRDFELFREDFTIDILGRYYSLVRQLREIANAESNLKSRERTLRQSEALFEVGDAKEADKLRAEREFLGAQNDLLTLRESYSLAVDRLKIQLGLPMSFPLVIRPEEPVFSDLDIDLRKAVDAALNNRIDLLTARDVLEDAERGVRIVKDRLLPDLDLSAGYTVRTPSSREFGREGFKDENYTLGLTLEIPLERTRERNDFRRALIDLDRARRTHQLATDNVILSVRSSLRRLRRAGSSLTIREQEVEAAERELRAAQYRFEEGEADNRNVSDAQNALLRSRNSYISDLVEYELARIQLIRDVGILFIDENGMVVEP